MYLSQNKIGYWHNINKRILIKKRNLKINATEKIIFIKNLIKIGYVKNSIGKMLEYSKTITVAFQRRFRQELINGIIDKECLLISENLAKKIK
jgi:N-acetylmuramoyl-L-alanine amidase